MIPLGLALAVPPAGPVPAGPVTAGTALGGGGNAVDDLVGQAQAAASAGLASVWLGQMYDIDPLTALAVIGREVPGIGLGTAVTVTHSRHPITMSSQAQTVQAATAGRLILGVGVSHRRPVEQRYGYSFDRPARHLREYLTALLPLLRDGKADFHGETLIADTAGFPAHVAGSVPPPVLAAALGPAMLRVAGELADGTVTWMAGLRTVARHIVPVINAAAAGRDAPQVVVSLPVCVTGEPAAASARAASSLAFYAQIPSYAAVLDLEQAGPADIAIIGDERHVERRLVELAEAGATHFIANLSGVTTGEERKRTLALLGALSSPRGSVLRSRTLERVLFEGWSWSHPSSRTGTKSASATASC